MPYAAENAISQSPILDGIEVTEEQYREGLEALISGSSLSIVGGFHIVIDAPPLEEPEPEPPTPEQLMARLVTQALSKNNQAYEAATTSVTAGYPQLEKDTWPTQDREVKAWALDAETAATPWIDTAAAVRGIDRTAYLARTLEKTQQFEQVSAYLTGYRQRYEDQIKAATTTEEIEAVNCVYQLPGV